MKRLIFSAAAASSLALGGCATAAQDRQVAAVGTGVVIGASVGAVAGSVIPGIGTGAGAAVGGILGSFVGAVVHGRQYYRDTRGYCYYVDKYGQPQYNYDVRC